MSCWVLTVCRFIQDILYRFARYVTVFRICQQKVTGYATNEDPNFNLEDMHQEGLDSWSEVWNTGRGGFRCAGIGPLIALHGFVSKIILT